MESDNAIEIIDRHDAADIECSDAQSIVQDCALLRLPAELRNDIYSVALTSTTGIMIPTSGNVIAPPLLHSCQQIRKEATKLYYAKNAFRALVTEDSLVFPGYPVLWASKVGWESCGGIRGLTLEYHIHPVHDAPVDFFRRGALEFWDMERHRTRGGLSTR